MDEKDKKKVVMNPLDARTVANAHHDPVLDPAEHNELLKILDERGGTQRGKARSRDPSKNPLGGRIFDMNCTWLMYRRPNGDTFEYTCGAYQQSVGKLCSSNRVSGELATRFVLSCLRQKLLLPSLLENVKKELRALADSAGGPDDIQSQVALRRVTISQLETNLQSANRNLALARNSDEFAAIAAERDKLKAQHSLLKTEIANLEIATAARDVDAEIANALDLAQYLGDLAQHAETLAKIGELFRQVNVRLFLRFRPVQLTKRSVHRVTGGVVTFGDAAPPVAIYNGPTDKASVKWNAENAAAVDAVTPGNGRYAAPAPIGSVGMEKSVGNVNRGERI